MPPTAEPAAPSPDTALASTTDYALNLPTESVDDEAVRREKRAERFGLTAAADAANGEADDEEKRKADRVKKFGTVGENTGLGKLNEALASERQRGPKRRKEGGDEDTAMDDPALIRRGGGRGGFRGRGGKFRGRGGRRGTPDRPSGVQKAYSGDKDKSAADARKKRFAAAAS